MTGELREALKKDFRALYVPEFSTMWEMERTVREIEIDIMPLTNLRSQIRQAVGGLENPYPEQPMEKRNIMMTPKAREDSRVAFESCRQSVLKLLGGDKG